MCVLKRLVPLATLCACAAAPILPEDDATAGGALPEDDSAASRCRDLAFSMLHLSETLIELDFGTCLEILFRRSRLVANVTSPSQEIKVWESPYFGRMITLDDALMITEQNEFLWDGLVGGGTQQEWHAAERGGNTTLPPCASWCTMSCTELNGDVIRECATCPEEFLCRPGAEGFGRRALPPGFETFGRMDRGLLRLQGRAAFTRSSAGASHTRCREYCVHHACDALLQSKIVEAAHLAFRCGGCEAPTSTVSSSCAPGTPSFAPYERSHAKLAEGASLLRTITARREEDVEGRFSPWLAASESYRALLHEAAAEVESDGGRTGEVLRVAYTSWAECWVADWEMNDRVRTARRFSSGEARVPWFPQTFVLPEQRALFATAQAAQPGARWLRKLPYLGQGNGVRLLEGQHDASEDDLEAAPARFGSYTVQRYIEDPMLVDGYKWHYRYYVTLTYVPRLGERGTMGGLVLSANKRAAVRFAAARYADASNGTAEAWRQGHVTNSATASEAASASELHCATLPWKLRTLDEVLAHLRATGRPQLNASHVHRESLRVVREAMTTVVSAFQAPADGSGGGLGSGSVGGAEGGGSGGGGGTGGGGGGGEAAREEHRADWDDWEDCHGLYGVDMMLDAAGRVWLHEIQPNPEMETACPADAPLLSEVILGCVTKEVRMLQKVMELSPDDDSRSERVCFDADGDHADSGDDVGVVLRVFFSSGASLSASDPGQTTTESGREQ